MPLSLLALLHRLPGGRSPRHLRRAAGRVARHAALAAMLLLLLLVPETVGAGSDSGSHAALSLAAGYDHGLVQATTSGASPPGVAVRADTPDATGIGQLTLTATYNSVGVELPFTGDANGTAVANLEFRRVDDQEWRPGLPLWRTADPSGAAFYGSALLLDAGSGYEVRVTVDDADGVVGAAQQVSTITTRAEELGPAEALTPTHFVRADGDDARDGRTPASAWRTLDKAVRDAPARCPPATQRRPSERHRVGRRDIPGRRH